MADYDFDDEAVELNENDLDLLHADLISGQNVSRRVIWKNVKEEPAQHQSEARSDVSRRKHHSAPRHASNAFGRIRVVVRCRPLLDNESHHKTERLQIEGDNVIIRHPITLEGKRFVFDRVLPPEAAQHDVFAEIHPMIEHVLNGFHATVFAYGQTGSGKTFTMDGLNYHMTKQGSVMVPIPDPDSPIQNHGVLPRVIQMIFDKAIGRQQANTDPNTGEPKEGCPKFDFKCSFLQIYNEKITDLLQAAPIEKGSSRQAQLDRSDNTGLRLRWLKGDVFRVENLFICECESPGRMREAFFRGVKEKVVSSHLMNMQSSRSHSIFTIYVTRRDAKTGDVLSRSEFTLVDLAGSEKLNAVASDAKSKIAKESIEINTSLLALGKVIIALANAKGKRNVHVPYRESKLTKLLKHAIGGNSLTTMIACISPSDSYIEESVSTMLYAGRAKNIENAPKINEDPNYAIIRQLREEIRQLKEELQYYRLLASRSVEQTERNAQNAVLLPPQNQTKEDPVMNPNIYDGQNNNNINNNNNNNNNNMLVSADHPANVQEKNELADSLIAACEMLKQIMAVNGQLRDAYDTLKVDRENAVVRETQLNAENLALRERIEMLESIVLNDEFLNTTNRNGNEPPEDEELEEEDEDEDNGVEEEEEGNAVKGVHSRPAATSATRQPTISPASKGEQYGTPHGSPNPGGDQHSQSGWEDDGRASPEEISTLPPFDTTIYHTKIKHKEKRYLPVQPSDGQEPEYDHMNGSGENENGLVDEDDERVQRYHEGVRQPAGPPQQHSSRGVAGHPSAPGQTVASGYEDDMDFPYDEDYLGNHYQSAPSPPASTPEGSPYYHEHHREGQPPGAVALKQPPAAYANDGTTTTTVVHKRQPSSGSPHVSYTSDTISNRHTSNSGRRQPPAQYDSDDINYQYEYYDNNPQVNNNSSNNNDNNRVDRDPRYRNQRGNNGASNTTTTIVRREDVVYANGGNGRSSNANKNGSNTTTTNNNNNARYTTSNNNSQQPNNFNNTGNSNSSGRKTIVTRGIPVQQRAAPPPKRSATTRNAEKIYRRKGTKRTTSNTRASSTQALRKQRLESKLDEYNQRYRQPKQEYTYVDYYGRAQRPTGTNRTNTTIEEMDMVLKKLPKQMASEVVPSSLRRNGNFGDLNFVGSRNDVEDYQLKRSEREEKLRALLIRNRELNMMVHSEVAGPPPPNVKETARRPGSYDRRPASYNERRPSPTTSGNRGATSRNYGSTNNNYNNNNAGLQYNFGPFDRRPRTQDRRVYRLEPDSQLRRPSTEHASSTGATKRRGPSPATYRESSAASSYNHYSSSSRESRPQFSNTMPPRNTYSDQGYEEYGKKLRKIIFGDENKRLSDPSLFK